MRAERGNARLQSAPGERQPDHPVPGELVLGSPGAEHVASLGRERTTTALPPSRPLQVIFPEKHWLPPDRLSQLEALLPPRQKVRVTEDMDQVELQEFDPNDQSWRQHREAYEEDDDGPRAGVQCQTA